MSDSCPIELLQAMPGQRILIVGDVMLDEFIYGRVRRISPEAPVPVVEVERRSWMPGGAANTAVNVRSLGGLPLLGGVVGSDPQAGLLREALARNGMHDAGLVVDDSRLTTTKTRIIAHNQQVVRADAEQRQNLSMDLETRLLGWVASRLPEADACVLSDYAKGVVSHRFAQEFIELARSADKPVVVDPKGAIYEKYRGATVLTPNLNEVERVLNREVEDEAGLLEAGRSLMALLGGSALLVTRGSRGMLLFSVDSAPLHVPAAARQVFDVTGAGDTVVSTLAVCLAAGAPLEQAVYVASHAAGLVVGKVGTASVSIEELMPHGQAQLSRV